MKASNRLQAPTAVPGQMAFDIHRINDLMELGYYLGTVAKTGTFLSRESRRDRQSVASEPN
jgi:hypothetical protein